MAQVPRNRHVSPTGSPATSPGGRAPVALTPVSRAVHPGLVRSASDLPLLSGHQGVPHHGASPLGRTFSDVQAKPPLAAASRAGGGGLSRTSSGESVGLPPPPVGPGELPRRPSTASLPDVIADAQHMAEVLAARLQPPRTDATGLGRSMSMQGTSEIGSSRSSGSNPIPASLARDPSVSPGGEWRGPLSVEQEYACDEDRLPCDHRIPFRWLGTQLGLGVWHILSRATEGGPCGGERDAEEEDRAPRKLCSVDGPGDLGVSRQDIFNDACVNLILG